MGDANNLRRHWDVQFQIGNLKLHFRIDFSAIEEICRHTIHEERYKRAWKRG